MSARISRATAKALRKRGLIPGAEPAKPRGMNATERAYAGFLENRRLMGGIKWFAFEPIRLRLGEGAFFKPDFLVMRNEETIECHETKGFMREAALVRLKVAADLYPWRFVIVRREGSGWTFETVARRET